MLMNAVPRHVWVTVITLAAMLLVSWLFFKPPLPVPGVSDEGVALAETVEARIVEVVAEEEMLVAEQPQPVQRVVVEITNGSRKGERIEVLHGEAAMLSEGTRVRAGDRVLIEHEVTPDGELYYITDFIRLPALLILTLLFAAAAVTVGRWVGLRALLSMGISVLVIAGFIIPGILAGLDPLLVCVFGSLGLMTASLYLVYGWTWKTR